MPAPRRRPPGQDSRLYRCFARGILGGGVTAAADACAMKLLIRNRQPPGDVLMLTAALRDLHRAHPGVYRTAVDTACPALWENNPFVERHDGDGPDGDWAADRVIEAEYPLIHQANHRPFHFIHGFVQDLARKLG